MAKIIIVYASFGEGHKRAAQALEGIVDGLSVDFLDFSYSFIKKFYSLSYLFISEYFPYIWQTLFFLAKKKFLYFLLNIFHKCIFFTFFKYLKENKPKAVIVTHFFPLSFITAVKDKLDLTLISVITDLRVHPLWVNKGVDYYFVALDKAKDDLLKMGITEKKIISGFVPLRQGFLTDTSREDLYQKFSFKPRPTLIFVSSLRGRFPFFKKATKILLKNFNIFVIYGRNKKLKKYLESLNSPDIKLFPFYENIWELISLSSVIITKPGGLTLFEGIYKKKPFIFTHYIPGQEKANMDLLIKYGIAKFVVNAEELIEAVDYFLRNSRELRKSYPLEIKSIDEPLKNLLSFLGK